MSLSPRERNQLRTIRDLLDLYERSPGLRHTVCDNVTRHVRELRLEHEKQHAKRLEESAAHLDETMARLKEGEPDAA
jgi:hypothetical protein